MDHRYNLPYICDSLIVYVLRCPSLQSYLYDYHSDINNMYAPIFQHMYIFLLLFSCMFFADVFGVELFKY